MRLNGYVALEDYIKIERGKNMVTKDMLIGEIVGLNDKYPEILLGAGMHCLGCPASAGETLEEACLVHGIDVDELIEKLNNV